jgi:hypothetical protein
MRFVLCAFLSLIPLSAATITSNAVTGNWSAGAMWVGGVPPGNGDTAVCVTGAHITGDGTPTIVGTSGATGTTAITVQGTCRISVATGATLDVRGDISCPVQANTTGCITGAGAGTILLDPSLAVTPASTHYRIKAAGGGAWTFINASDLTIKADPSGQRGLIDDSDQTQGGAINCDSCYFQYLALQPAPFAGILSPTLISNSTLDNSYVAVAATCSTDCSITLKHNRWINNSSTGFNFEISANGNQTALAVTNSTADQLFGQGPLGGGSSSMPGATITGNDFEGGFSESGDLALADSNFFRLVGSQSSIALGGPMTRNFFYLDNHAATHTHLIDITSTGPAYFAYNILSAGINTTPDGLVEPVGANSGVYTMEGNIVLCQPDGTGGNLRDMRGENTSQTIADHNTACALNPENNLGVVASEAETMALNHRGYFTNNLSWAASAGTTSFAVNAAGDADGPTTDLFNPANIFNNGNWNMVATSSGCGACTNQANSFIGAWTSTPGATGLVTGNPNFVDPARTFATFDSAYLGHTPGAWNSGTTYTAAQTSSSANGSAWGAQTINFTAVASGTNQQPGASWTGGSSWWSYWELASLTSVRNAINAGATITDAAIGCYGCSYPQAFIGWIGKGFTPTNAIYIGHASDGGTIGAVNANPSAPASLGGNVSIGGNAVAQ